MPARQHAVSVDRLSQLPQINVAGLNRGRSHDRRWMHPLRVLVPKSGFPQLVHRCCAGGEKLKGAINEIGAEGFQFVTRANEPPRTIGYD